MTDSRSAMQILRSIWPLAALAVATIEGTAWAVPVNGDIVFVQDAMQGNKAAIIQADRNNGNRTVISQFGVRGSGPDFNFSIGGIDVAANGDIYASGSNGSAIFRINPKNGDRTIVSSPLVGTGPFFSSGGDLIVAPTGDIFVAREDQIVRVNTTTGNRSVISGPARGTGQLLRGVFGLTITPSGNFFALETSALGPDDDLVFLVNGSTGNRTIVSGGNVGSGPMFNHLGIDVELLRDGDLAVVDHANRILRVNVSTGARSILAGSGVGTGPDLGALEWLSLDSRGFLIATTSDRIFSVDPANGNRTLFTGGGFGTGTAISTIREAVEFSTVPEPSGIVLGCLGLVALVGWMTRRRNV